MIGKTAIFLWLGVYMVPKVAARSRGVLLVQVSSGLERAVESGAAGGYRTYDLSLTKGVLT